MPFNGLYHTRRGLDTGIRVRSCARVVVVGDLHLISSGNMSLISAIADIINEIEADLVVFAGDVVNEAYNYAETLAKFYPNQPFSVPGNHDVRGGVLDTYVNSFTWLPTNGVSTNRHSWYKSVGDTLRIYGINSNISTGEGITATGDQAIWLRAASAAATEPWQFSVWHHSAYSNDPVHGDSASMQWGHGPGEPLEYMTAVLSGNSHHYERLLKGAKTYIVCGSGGPTLYNFSGTTDSMAQIKENGIVIIDTNWGECTIRFMNLDGLIRDQLTLTR
jgi:DNA repair exonuclease SbcCD nuclease subunit